MKKIMKIAFVAAFAAVAGYGVYANQQSETMSDLMLANVEALAGSCYFIIQQLISCTHIFYIQFFLICTAIQEKKYKQIIICFHYILFFISEHRKIVT